MRTSLTKFELKVNLNHHIHKPKSALLSLFASVDSEEVTEAVSPFASNDKDVSEELDMTHCN